MVRLQILDSPIDNPDDDIFGMAVYAEMLADFIRDVRPPFTVGVYGEWGEGKTSFVELLKTFLVKPVANEEHSASDDKSLTAETSKFITFSAWPHSTSDALWRALIINIARELYEVDHELLKKDESSKNKPDSSTPSGLWDRISTFLASDAYVINRPPPSPDPLKTYKDTISQIDKTIYGSISKSAEHQRDVQQEVAFMSVVNAALSALGTISPIIAGIRGLIGSNVGLNMSDIYAEKNEATRKMIESIGEFKKVFRDLFKDKVKEYRRVFVFVDDLDRCLPDVALDLLEAIKVFLDDVEFIFIVAADENLIGQGLKIRFQQLFVNNEQVESQGFFDQKGQEYFEKIIQFSVRVPPRTPDQAHTFIAAQFPNWTAATDIIQTAIGNNPRRLKQYCNLLTYKYLVAQVQSQATSNTRDEKSLSLAETQLLNKIITLHCRDLNYLERLTRLLKAPPTFKKVMEEIEQLLKGAKEDDERPEAAELLTEPEHLELYKIAIKNAAVLRLMQSPPHFSVAQPMEITTLARLSDVRPHAGGSSISSDNPFFMRILSTAETLTPGKLLTDDFTKLIHFDQHYPEMGKLLFEIAKNEKWTNQLAAIESELAQQSITSIPANDLGPKGSELRELLLKYQKLEDSLDETRLKVFLQPPLFSTMLAEEVQLYLTVQNALPDPAALLAQKLFESTNPVEKSHRIAGAIVEQLKNNPDYIELEKSIALQLRAAFYFLELRKFVKVDALNHKWRSLAQQLLSGGIGPLKALEGEAVKSQPSAQAVPESFAPYLRDRQLLRFLALRPPFKDFYKQDFEDYFAAAQAVKVEQPVVPVISAPPTAEQVASPPPPIVPPIATVTSVPIFENLHLKITPLETAAVSPAQVAADGTTIQASSKYWSYSLNFNDGKKAPETYTFKITETDFENLKVLPEESFSFRGLSSKPITRQHYSASRLGSTDLNSILTNTGSRLCNVVFSDKEPRTAFINALKENPHLRIALELGDPLLTSLPWENLFLGELGIFPSLIRKYSMIRYFPNASSLFPRTLIPPLRILGVTATPDDAPMLDVRQERETMERTLAPQIQSGVVKLEFTNSGTLEEVQRALRRFEPHLFHFLGHGVYVKDQQQGVLLFEDEEKKSRAIEASVLRNLLVDSNISLAVLNACDTGSSGALDAITSVAGALVRNGIPAAIGTMRPMLDSAAVMFTRNFYSSFADGYTLEAALTEARKALSFEKWDWAAYALFASTTNLDAFRLTSGQVRSD